MLVVPVANLKSRVLPAALINWVAMLGWNPKVHQVTLRQGFLILLCVGKGFPRIV